MKLARQHHAVLQAEARRPPRTRSMRSIGTAGCSSPRHATCWSGRTNTSLRAYRFRASGASISPEVGGIAAYKHSPLLEPIGDQAAADPVLLGDHLVFEVRPHAEYLADRPVAIDGIEFGFMRLQVIVDQPSVSSVDRDSRAAAARIERQIHPGVFAGKHRQEIRRADTGRLHALDHRGAG